MSVTHPFVSTKTDGSDDTVVRPSNWNAPHVVDDDGKGFLIQGDPSTGELISSGQNFSFTSLATDPLTTGAGAKTDLSMGSGVEDGVVIANIAEYSGDGIPVIVQASVSGGQFQITIGNAGLVPLSDVATINFLLLIQS